MATYLVYARRFRPQTFAEVVGQESAVESLRQAIAQGRVGHAYLFCGPRGVGKTTTARILAKALNCESGPSSEPCGECASCRAITSGESLDVTEIDAASHASVADIRSLREEATYSTHRSRFRVYIIDEVHMLATSSQQAAFNAFLKILEEPPPHVKFILCTTDPQRILETVRSRCQRLDFRRITSRDVVARLAQIAEREELEVAADALREVARHAEGGLRDAEVLLEQLSVYADGAITVDHVRALTGAVDEAKLAGIAGALAAGETARALEEADAILESGTDSGELMDALLAHLRAAIAVQACGEDSPIVRSRGIDVEAAGATAGALAQEELLYAAAVLQSARKEARASSRPRINLELALVRLSRVKELVSLEEIAGELDARSKGAGRARGGGRAQAAPTRRDADPRAGRQETGALPEAEPETVPQGRDGPPPEVTKPPPEPTGPPPPAVEGALTLDNVSERWPFVVARVAELNMTAGACLKSGSLSSVGGDTVTVGFSASQGFQREQLSEAGSLSAVASAASEVLGRPVKVRLTALRRGKSGRSGPAASARDRPGGRGESASQRQAAPPREEEPGGAHGRSGEERYPRPRTSGPSGPSGPSRRAAGRGRGAGASGRGREAEGDDDEEGEHAGSGEDARRGGRERPEVEALRDPGIRRLVRKTGGMIVRVEDERE